MAKSVIVAQNKPLLYNFAEIPQTLLLNPAAETNYQYHIGIPSLSGFSLETGSTGFSLSNIFADDGRNVNDKITKVFSNLKTSDFAKVYIHIEILSGGLRLNEKTHISFGFYQEVDAIGYYPKDIVTLITEGNTSHINENFKASQINYKLDALGVWHFGISKNVNENLILGSRFKVYSSALNLESKNNTGTFTTVQGTNNLYTHHLNNISLEAKSSGLVDEKENEYIDDFGSYFGNTFFGANLGVGLDFGVTYKISPQLEFSASILDIGFVNYKDNVKNTKVEGNFSFEGVDFLFDAENSTNYWDLINNRFKRDLPTTESQESYISWRPIKINGALKYRFGDIRKRVCYNNRDKDFYTDAIGLQLFNVFRPSSRMEFALTGFYEKSLTNEIDTKFTYTIDNFSYANFGAGISVQIGKINTYALVDNIFSHRNLSTANHVSLQLGFNIIFN